MMFSKLFSASKAPVEGEETAQLDIETINEQYMLDAVSTALENALTSKSQATKNTYGPKQKEYQAWCALRQFKDGSLVTEKKFITFLQTQVAGRSLRRLTKKHKATGSLTTPVLKMKTVGLYAAAIVSLWAAQHARGETTGTHPKTMVFCGLMQTLHQKAHAKKIRDFEDRGINTLLDGYNEQQMMALAALFWENGLTTKVGISMRTYADFLLRHYGLLRGSETRQAFLSEMMAMKLEREGSTECWAMILGFSASKLSSSSGDGTSAMSRSPTLPHM
ncbi:hypothetical protein K402DRAFT_82890 [Aulographum hederae CBS 113979]|uniref:Uncharacterized protein n=1 Tax=Aulographum hederae CBS 113979 TaxID=1176131 RepID=A0A6G1H033_9PEZI|nr:hypothetical protein K402DRAFT_82890 [Aulographum hederae CBS 113979]